MPRQGKFCCLGKKAFTNQNIYFGAEISKKHGLPEDMSRKEDVAGK